MKFDNIFLLGDIHGNYERLLSVVNNLPNNSLLIQVGDFGLGFSTLDREAAIKDWVSDCLHNVNSKLFVIRGNHDKKENNFPSTFRDNIEFLDDYTYRTINDKTWLFVGGATSIDKHMRREGVTYWRDEGVVYAPDKCKDKCDVLVLHSAPASCFPHDTYESLRDTVKLYVPEFANWREEMVKVLAVERHILSRIFTKTSPSKLFYGHFHKSHTEIIDGCECTLLNIDELHKLCE